jgi:hypothetical protein
LDLRRQQQQVHDLRDARAGEAERRAMSAKSVNSPASRRRWRSCVEDDPQAGAVRLDDDLADEEADQPPDS